MSLAAGCVRGFMLPAPHRGEYCRGLDSVVLQLVQRGRLLMHLLKKIFAVRPPSVVSIGAILK